MTASSGGPSDKEGDAPQDVPCDLEAAAAKERASLSIVGLTSAQAAGETRHTERVEDVVLARRLADAEAYGRQIDARLAEGGATALDELGLHPEVVEMELRAHSHGDAERDPDFWHGLDEDADDWDARWTRRLTEHHAAYGFDAGRPMLPCYAPGDLKLDSHGQQPEVRDLRPLPLLLSDLADAHVDHWYWSAPFCGRCHDDLLAEARLRR